MIILSFDIATHTGVAFGASGETPRTTTIDLGQGRSHDVRFAKAIRMTRHFITTFKPDLVVYEAPIGGKFAGHFLIGAAACVVGQCGAMGVKTQKVDIASVRKHFLGRHYVKRDFPGKSASDATRAIKQLCIDRCHLLGWTVGSDDAADAAACWDYAQATTGRAQAAPAGGLFGAQ